MAVSEESERLDKYLNTLRANIGRGKSGNALEEYLGAMLALSERLTCQLDRPLSYTVGDSPKRYPYRKPSDLNSFSSTSAWTEVLVLLSMSVMESRTNATRLFSMLPVGDVQHTTDTASTEKNVSLFVDTINALFYVGLLIRKIRSLYDTNVYVFPFDGLNYETTMHMFSFIEKETMLYGIESIFALRLYMSSSNGFSQPEKITMASILSQRYNEIILDEGTSESYIPYLSMRHHYWTGKYYLFLTRLVDINLRDATSVKIKLRYDEENTTAVLYAFFLSVRLTGDMISSVVSNPAKYPPALVQRVKGREVGTLGKLREIEAGLRQQVPEFASCTDDERMVEYVSRTLVWKRQGPVSDEDFLLFAENGPALVDRLFARLDSIQRRVVERFPLCFSEDIDFSYLEEEEEVAGSNSLPLAGAWSQTVTSASNALKSTSTRPGYQPERLRTEIPSMDSLLQRVLALDNASGTIQNEGDIELYRVQGVLLERLRWCELLKHTLDARAYSSLFSEEDLGSQIYTIRECIVALATDIQ